VFRTYLLNVVGNEQVVKKRIKNYNLRCAFYKSLPAVYWIERQFVCPIQIFNISYEFIKPVHFMQGKITIFLEQGRKEYKRKRIFILTHG